MRKLGNSVVFITGASSGIGEALAYEYAKQGAKLALVARRSDRLKAIEAKIKTLRSEAISLVGDVTKANDLNESVKQAIEKYSRIDIAIANAGFGVVGPFEQLEAEDYRRQFETNIFGVLNTVWAVLPELKKTKGTLVLIGSVAGHISLAQASPYGMSKFAIHALAESLRAELKPAGVSVVLIAPGFIESDIRKVDNHGVSHANQKEPLPAYLVMPKEKAARQMVRAIFRKKREAVITYVGKLAVFLKNHFPALIWFIAERGVRGRSQPKN